MAPEAYDALERLDEQIVRRWGRQRLTTELTARANARADAEFKRAASKYEALQLAGRYANEVARVFDALDAMNEIGDGKSRDEITALGPPAWLVRDRIPFGTYTVMFGLPGSFKTSVAYSLCEAVARKSDWCESDTRSGVGCMFSGEGDEQFQPRVHAYNSFHPLNGAKPRSLVIWDKRLDLTSFETLSRLVCAIERVRRAAKAKHGVCVFDPSGLYRGGEPGAIENTEPLALSMTALAKALPTWAFVVVSHTDAEGKRMRGTDHLHMYAGSHIRVDKGGAEHLTLVWEKQRAAKERVSRMTVVEPGVGGVYVKYQSDESLATYRQEKEQVGQRRKAEKAEAKARESMRQRKELIVEKLRDAEPPGWTADYMQTAKVENETTGEEERLIPGDTKQIPPALEELVAEGKLSTTKVGKGIRYQVIP